jgi:hypothetical protein
MDLIRTAKERYVCDAANSNSPLSCADRSEGDPPSLIADVNDAYDFAGTIAGHEVVQPHGPTRRSWSAAGRVLSGPVCECKRRRTVRSVPLALQ